MDDYDPTTTLTTRFSSATPEELSEIMKHDAKLWNDLLWISGGLLELDKCSYHHIHFDFDNDGNASPRLGHVGPPITIPDNQSHANIEIPSKCVVNPHKTLGHYKAPSGNGASQLRILKNKSNTLGQQVSNGPFNKHDAWTFYRSIYLPSVGYVLPQNFFTAKQLKAIQTSAMSSIIAKCGYNRKSKTEIIYGPKSLAGAGFVDLYTIQGTGQIKMFLKFWRTTCQASRLLKVAHNLWPASVNPSSPTPPHHYLT